MSVPKYPIAERITEINAPPIKICDASAISFLLIYYSPPLRVGDSPSRRLHNLPTTEDSWANYNTYLFKTSPVIKATNAANPPTINISTPVLTTLFPINMPRAAPIIKSDNATIIADVSNL